MRLSDKLKNPCVIVLLFCVLVSNQYNLISLCRAHYPVTG